jgi:hypothetical protein
MFKEVSDTNGFLDTIGSATAHDVMHSLERAEAISSGVIQLLPSPVIILIGLWFLVMAYYRVQKVTQVHPLEKMD